LSLHLYSSLEIRNSGQDEKLGTFMGKEEKEKRRKRNLYRSFLLE
jgi:hypothetical protein